MELKTDLTILQNALYDFSRRNSFVHIRPKSLWFGQEDAAAEKIYQRANFYRKEYGLETTLEVSVFIKWKPPVEKGAGRSSFYLSPLFYRPCRLKKIQKIETEFAIKYIESEEVFYTNPVLRYYFEMFFDFKISGDTTDPNAEKQKIIDFFNSGVSAEKLEVTEEFNDIDSWQLINKKAVGNFNYKKSTLGADYTEIIAQPNASLKRLLAGDSPEQKKDIAIAVPAFLDQSQQEAIRMGHEGDTVIQGPPGTGKSHTIVALIGSYLLKEKKVLFVSEKRSALEVVNDRLKKLGWTNFVAYFNTDKDQKKTFYKGLKKAWEKLNQTEVLKADISEDHPLSEGLLTFYPEGLNQVRMDFGLTLNTLISDLLQFGKDVEQLKGKGKVPKYDEWQNQLKFLVNFEVQLLPAFKAKSLAETVFVELNKVVFSEPETIQVLERRVNDLEEVLLRIQVLQKKYTLNEGFDHFVKLALTGSILNMVNKVQIDLLNTDSKKYKSFNTWSKKYQLLKSRYKQALKANEKWTKKPTISEITELMDLLSSEGDRPNKSFLGRLRRNPTKLKEAFRDFHSGIGVHTRIKLLESLKLEWRLKGELEEVELKLKHNLNIHHPETEIDLIFNLRNKLDTVSQNEYLKILEHPRSTELIQDLDQIHPDILKFNAQNRFLFYSTEIESLNLFQEKLLDLKQSLPLLNHWLPELKTFFKLPVEIRNFIRSNPHSVRKLTAIINYQTLLDETRFEPVFKNLSGTQLLTQIRQIYTTTRARHKALIDVVRRNIKRNQLEVEQLLSRPSYKLKENQKQQKKSYKTARRLMLHEMNKQQRHLSVKSLFESTASHLLRLQPVWIMNPLTVSEFLPCQPDLFDVVIFDESSQIPVEDAIPAIYRAKQIVVVGDSKQMPPSAFFSSKTDTPTLLDKAEQALPNKMLNWHYRSNHPDLIRFSNMEFYNGELISLPPQSFGSPIELKYVDGIYESGKNEREAEEIASYVEASLKNGENDILIIAFSQEQEKEIRRKLSKNGLMSAEEVKTRNLENAQGIESGHVIISIGYGKNELGDFRLNFGPVNQVNGANRLNVLFTRAIDKLTVFSSVKSTDFGLPENQGIQLVKDFLTFAEHGETEIPDPSSLPYAHKKVMKILDENNSEYTYYGNHFGIGTSAFIQHETGKVLLVDPGLGDEVMDVMGFKNLMFTLKKRYKEMKIVLSLDLWLRPERTQKEIIDFFVEGSKV